MLEEVLKPKLHILEGKNGPRVVAFCDGESVRDAFEITRSQRIPKDVDLVYCQTYGQRNSFDQLVNCKMPYVVHVGGDIWDERRETKSARLLPDVSRCMRRAAAIVCVGKFLATVIAGNLGSADNIRLLPGGLWGTDTVTKGIDPGRFVAKTNWAIKGRPLVVMNINLSVTRKWRGIPMFLNAVKGVIKKRDIRIIWVCRLKERHLGVAEDIVDEYGVEIVSPSDRWPELLRTADLFVHPSGFDGFPRALAESCCVALPALAFDIAGSREVSKYVKLCNPYNGGDVVSGFCKLLDSERLRNKLGTGARKDALRKTISHRGDYAKLLLDILECKRV